MTRTITALLAAIAIAAAALPAAASAGQYRHLACPGTLADGTTGWQATRTSGVGTLRTSSDCDAGGWMKADIWVLDGNPAVSGGQWAGWRYYAPSSTRITGFSGSLAGWMAPFNSYHEGAIIVRESNPNGGSELQWFEDRSGANTLLNDASKPASVGWWGLSSTTVEVTATCAAPSQDPAYWCNAWSPVWMAFKNAVVHLNDNQAPVSGTATGTLVSEQRLAGNKTIAAALTDQGGGVRQLVVKADGAEITRAQLAGGSCVPNEPDTGQGAGYTAPVPCPNSVTANVTIDTTRIADGTHTITATAIDAAGNSTIVYEADKTIANIPPANTRAPRFTDQQAAASPAPGRPLDAERGAWDGPNLTYSQQWQRCDQDGSTCVDIAGATGTRYTPTAADAGFRLRFTVTAVNLAGSVSKTTSLTGVVAAPEQSPTAVGQTPSSLIKTPELPGVTGTGEGRGSLNGSVIGSDNGTCSKDQFVLHATRYKGNVVRLRYGSKVAIRVKLTCQTGGYPISGAKLQTATLIPGQGQAVGGEITTDKKGEAIIRAGKGPSRGITIGYRLYTREDVLRAELRLRVAVRGKITLTVTQGLHGQARFHGRVTGGHIPGRGVTIQLQFLDPRDGWRPIKNMVTDNRGRYSYRYQFKQPVSFKFRAVVAPGQTDYPFMPARSKVRIGHG